MNDSIVIWGSGLIGNLAYFYYKDICDIVCYVDSDERKWGTTLNGIKICSPDILRDVQVKVVLALKRDIENIQKQLEKDYGIKQSIWFQVCNKMCSIENTFNELPEDSCIVYFGGGLGNQMFQYAFLRYLEKQGKNAVAFLNTSSVTSQFHLLNVFRNIDLCVCSEKQKDDLVIRNMEIGGKTKKFILYTEEGIYEVDEKKTDLSMGNVTGGVFQGLFQTYKWAEQIKEILLKDFSFENGLENKLKVIQKRITEGNTVSVHIRRGDYLSDSNKWFYGDICTSEYYTNAMKLMKKKIGDCKFIFFSDDIKWVKDNYKMDGAMYIENTMFDSYQNWYDMYLMSICKHNIIANSTFSWWGAWLNQNKDKNVIAPEKWINLCDYKDIYPNEWIKL